MESWQTCPLCKGSGIFNGYTSTNAASPCPVCNGARILSTVTGLPPVRQFQDLGTEKPYKPTLDDLKRYSDV